MNDMRSMNGGWQLLFKLVLVTYPLVVSCGAWVFQVLREHDGRITRIESTTFSVDYRSQLVTDIGVLKDGAVTRDRRLDQIDRRMESIDKKLEKLLEGAATRGK